jgi:hypothetical protein
VRPGCHPSSVLTHKWLAKVPSIRPPRMQRAIGWASIPE